MSTPNLALPILAAAQAQKHITVNEALARLDGLVQLSVISAALTAPPGTPVEGDRYIIGSGATGAWNGWDNSIALFSGGAWLRLIPQVGWMAWDVSASELLVWNGSAWVSFVPNLQNLSGVGIGTASDATNRLAVSAVATLLNHAGNGHQLKVNKATTADTASLLFQTNWSGRAEMGTTGSDDFEIKVSADGAAWNQSLVADAATGVVSFPSGTSGLADSRFGTSSLTTVDYLSAKGVDLVTNGTGLLGNTYNMPGAFVFDPQVTPSLPATFSYTGYQAGVVTSTEFMAVNPHACYRLSSVIRQVGHAHLQYYGLLSLDLDGHVISSQDHMVVWDGGVSSRTTLAAPLAPGDTTISVVDASGWNNTDSSPLRRNITIFEYRNSAGFTYEFYSRIWQRELFNAGGVNKTTNVISLNQGWPSAMHNPDDPNGIWPAGTRIANGASGATYKYAGYVDLLLPSLGTWYSTKAWVGGIDRSGLNVTNNFPPGTAFVRLFWLPNHSNMPGGWGGYPDSGDTAPVWFGGLSLVPDYAAKLTRAADGRINIVVPEVNAAGNGWDFVGPEYQLAEV